MAARHKADLHVHTTASDGTLSPEQVVRTAYDVGLAAVGISDHDTVDGIPSALAAGKSIGIMVVPGVEINTDYGKDEIHILGYYIDHECDALLAKLIRLRNERAGRAERFVERLGELGVRISLDRVHEIAGTAAIGRPHIARAIVEAGYASSMGSAFGKYLVRGTPAYVPRYKLTPFEAIDIIEKAGGVPVLAHPGLTRHEELIPSLVNAGLKGLEVYHTEHSSTQAKYFLGVARRHGLVATGGSDSHGPNNMKVVTIGNVTVDMSAVHDLCRLSSNCADVQSFRE